MKSFKILSKFDSTGNSPLLEVGFYAGRPFFSLTPIYKNGERLSLVTKEKIFCGLYSMDKLLIKDGLKKILTGKIKRYTIRKTFQQGKITIAFTGETSKYPKGSLKIISNFQEKNMLVCNLEDYEKLENISYAEEEKINKDIEFTNIKDSPRLFALQEIYDAICMIDSSVLVMNALGFGPEDKMTKSDKNNDDDFTDDDDYDFEPKKATSSKKSSSNDEDEESEEYVTEEEYEEEEEEAPKKKSSKKSKKKSKSSDDEDEETSEENDLPF